MFKRKRYTKWIPFANYKWVNSHEMIVLVRKNKKNGMLQFKTKRINETDYIGLFIKDGLIDTNKVFQEVLKM